MNRTAVFAHFDQNKCIRDYVVYYLKELKKFCSKIIFISDSDIKEEEKQKIIDICEYIEAKKHGEYDFGSYKRGYLYLKENDLLNNTDELIFANDSCYEMFETMDKKECDFWGITKNDFDIDDRKNEHLQSYFFVLKKQIFTSEIFDKFITNVTHEDDKFDVVRKYEQGLTKVLKEAGFNFAYYSKDYKVKCPHILAWKKLLIDDKIPFLKANVIRLKEYRLMFPFGWKKIMKK